MAMTKLEIMEWLDSLEDDDLIYIDEGGLTLCAEGPGLDGVYLEVGGYPDDEEESDELQEGRV